MFLKKIIKILLVETVEKRCPPSRFHVEPLGTIMTSLEVRKETAEIC